MIDLSIRTQTNREPRTHWIQNNKNQGIKIHDLGEKKSLPETSFGVEVVVVVEVVNAFSSETGSALPEDLSMYCASIYLLREKTSKAVINKWSRRSGSNMLDDTQKHRARQ